ncbi:hypothetical protein HHI36_024229 [Cryptolaemus montrouzieri]|uniref:Uncharacterized protein n=1 Tax=Cryptolaemus montrouzieri TaxID=559131 RepID=A0ABD2NCD4_9CUCU
MRGQDTGPSSVLTKRRSETNHLAQARYVSRDPLPRQARHASILRANPYPEVTDPICRLPLPTLFYRLEALYLGDQLRIWVRAGATPTRGPLPDFQGPRRRSGHCRNCGALRVPNHISLLEDSMELERSCRKKTLPGSLDGVSGSFWVAPTNSLARARFNDGSAAGFRNRNRIPFARTGVLDAQSVLDNSSE